MEKTANYGLPKWVETDPIKMKPFNDAFDDIDKALKTNADAVAAKADASAVTAIAQTIANGKICRVKYGSYIGDGTYGAANPVSIECDFYPLLVLVSNASSNHYWALRGINNFYYSNNRDNVMTWGNINVSWYYPQDDQYYPPAGNQMNKDGTIYYYLVLGCEEND